MTSSELRKVARIRNHDSGILYFNCPCEADPPVPLNPAAKTRCECGRVFNSAGWIIPYEPGDLVTRTDDDTQGSVKRGDRGIVKDAFPDSAGVAVFWPERGMTKVMDPREIAPC